MSLVYQARQNDLNRVVALKILRPELSHEADTVQRFHHEARSAAQLDHPNIIPIYEIGELDGPSGLTLHYIAMKFIQGRTLKDMLQAEGRLEPRQAAHILAKAGHALEYAHRQGIIHRDIKPSNILISDEGTIYLSDFGLACPLGSRTGITKTGVVMGTPEYMAPEQAEGKADIGPAADIYALGVVLYEMLTGDLPFEGETPMGIMVARLTQEPRPLSSVSDGLPPAAEDIIMRALARDPAERFASVQEMLAALRSLEGLEGTAAAPHAQSAAQPPNTGPTISLPQQAAQDRPRSFWKRAQQGPLAFKAAALVAIFVAAVAIGAVSIFGITRSATGPATTMPVIPTPLVQSTHPAFDELLAQGWTQFDKARYNEARQFFEEAAQLDERNPAPMYGIGRVLMAQEMYDQAIEQFTEAVRHDARNAEYHAWLGEAHLQWGVANDTGIGRDIARDAYAQAEQSYRRALSLDPRQETAVSGLGWVFYQQGQYPDARDQFATAITVVPRQSSAHSGLGWALYTLENYREARASFYRAVELNNSNSRAYYGLGLANEELGNTREAREAYEQVLRLDPDDTEIQERLVRLE
jgi:serine/threonine-protein kinase